MSKSKYFEVVWNAPHNVKALITTRSGGIIDNIFGNFNLAYHVGDNENNVRNNRALLNPDLPDKPHWLSQTHTNLVLDLDNTPPAVSIPNYDASFTHKYNTVCAIMTADCLPILLTDLTGSFVAAVHAGWRGLHNGIIANTIKACTATSKNIIAYIGPAICAKHYEVGIEVFNLFIQQNPANTQCFTQKTSNKFDCDLVGIATLQLQHLGVPQQQIFLSNECTYCNSDTFYSFRKENKTGRFASLIWLEQTFI